MSNIEPTEEQKQAAIAWAQGPKRNESFVDAVARLLAEREAKAMCKGAAIAWGTVWDSSAPSDVIKVAEDVKGLHHRIERLTAHAKAADEGLAEREAKLRAEATECPDCCGGNDQHTHHTMDCDISPGASFIARESEADTLRARVAELEASRDHPKTWAAVEAREAQHLADIRALKSSRDDAVQRAVNLFDEYRRAGFVSPHPAVDLGEAFHLDLDARLAHYDDAKADALKEWEHHVTKTAGKPGVAFCGAPLWSSEWTFVSTDHARGAIDQQQRLQPCPACWKAIEQGGDAGSEPTSTTKKNEDA